MSRYGEERSYQNLSSYLASHPGITLRDFEAGISHGLDLFSTGVDFDFPRLEANMSAIEKALPSLRRIFKKPLIELKEEDRIVPVEAAEAISSKTLMHLAEHPELWEKVEGDTLTPRQLLSRTYQDLYATYENVLVVRYFQKALSYCRSSLARLRGMMYAGLSLNINLLDRENHRNYYVALQQLQASYIQNYSTFSAEAGKDIQKLEAMISSMLSYTNRPIYKHCKNFKGKLSLHKTNILGMQKDYHRVYLSYRSLFAKKRGGIDEESSAAGESFQSYLRFVKCIALYAALNYGFAPDSESALLDDPAISFSLSGWRMSVEEKPYGFLLSFQKEGSYRIALLPKKGQAPEGCDCSYSFGEWEDEPDLCLSMSDVDSFRRIQQLFLKGMVYSDFKREVCPFCQGELTYDKKSHAYLCASCHQTIQEKQCPETGRKYFSTGIARARWLPIEEGENEFEREHRAEAMYRYRNINRYNMLGEEICPCCHKTHHE